MSLNTNNEIINLAPGEVYFGQAPATICTLLGSCVALTVWHQKLKIGGMCHFLLSCEKKAVEISDNNYKYAKPALNYLYRKMLNHAAVNDYEIKLFGGSNMYPNRTKQSIGQANVDFTKQWLKDYSLQLKYEDTLGDFSRKLTFNLETGEVQLKHNQ